MALLNQRKRELQAQILRGPPPLGPGAPAAERFVAFSTAYLAFVNRQLDLVLMSETSSPGPRLRTGAHGFCRQHCRYLLTEHGAPDADLQGQAVLAAEQVQHWLRVEGSELDDVARVVAAAALGRWGAEQPDRPVRRRRAGRRPAR